jgi:hypothetical protein
MGVSITESRALSVLDTLGVTFGKGREGERTSLAHLTKKGASSMLVLRQTQLKKGTLKCVAAPHNNYIGHGT